MRIDAYLASSGLLSSRTEAKRYVENGLVLVNGVTITKPSFNIDESNSEITLIEQACRNIQRQVFSALTV